MILLKNLFTFLQALTDKKFQGKIIIWYEAGQVTRFEERTMHIMA